MKTPSFAPVLLALAVFGAAPSFSFAAEGAVVAPAADFGSRVLAARPRVVLADGSVAADAVVRVEQRRDGGVLRTTLTNVSGKPVSVREAVIADVAHGLAPDTEVFTEGFQKLAMIGGTLAAPRDLGSYPDRTHYRIPEPEGLRTGYGVFTVAPAGAARTLIASASCRRFISRFSFDGARLRVSFDCEDRTLAPGASFALEDLLVVSGGDREALFDRLAAEVAKHHPRLRHDIPAGWCSWICFGPGVTAKNVADAADWIAKNEPRLKYIQIDDGYQPWMGDWLETGTAFGGGVKQVLQGIRAKGLEPAIWVAPFIASPQSRLFREHPDWFVKDVEGKPLSSDKVGFGGWRQGPWYVLDGTHPGAQAYLTHVFKTMREEWGVTYFKLDANYWGAMHGGVHHDKSATRIEAYRRGMEAVMKGSGDAFLLGCNHPLWPSLGLVHGSRSSMDIAPNWPSFKKIAEENMHRAWQNGRFWWNDPDTVLLDDSGAKDVMDPGGERVIGKAAAITENEFRFHATSIYAAGGLVLSGDDFAKVSPAHVELLKKLLPPTGVAARFPDERFEVGEIHLRGAVVYAVFNAGDKPARRVVRLARRSALREKLTGADLGVHEGEYVIGAMPGRSGLLIEAVAAP